MATPPASPGAIVASGSPNGAGAAAAAPPGPAWRYYHYEELETITSRFSSCLGAGGFAQCFRGQLPPSGPSGGGQGPAAAAAPGALVAVKKVKESVARLGAEADLINAFTTECRLMDTASRAASAAGCPHLLPLLGLCWERATRLCMVLPLMPNGSVADHLSSRAQPPQGPKLTQGSARVRVGLQAAKGVSFLHGMRPRLLHRDIKPENLLLAEDLTAYVADYGISRVIGGTGGTNGGDSMGVNSAGFCGTPGHIAPETAQCFRYSVKTDVYAFGVTLLRLITNLEPVVSLGEAHALALVTHVRRRLGLDANGRPPAGGLAAPPASAWDSVRVDEASPCAWEPQMLAGLGAVALRCCEEAPEDRPLMAEVVLLLEDLLADGGGRTAYGMLPEALVALIKECSICMDRPRDVVFMPCSHAVACSQCAERMLESCGPGRRLRCPCCRAEVANTCPADGPVVQTFWQPRPAPALPQPGGGGVSVRPRRLPPVLTQLSETTAATTFSGGTGGEPLTWPLRVRLATLDGRLSRFAAFPPADVAGGPFAALQAVAAAKMFPGQAVVLSLPEGEASGGIPTAEIDDDDAVSLVVDLWLAETGGRGGPSAMPTLLVMPAAGGRVSPGASPGADAPSPPAAAPAPLRSDVPANLPAADVDLDVGTTVVLARGFASVGDARRGCLTPGALGSVVEVRSSIHLGPGYSGVRGYCVKAGSDTWFYARAALCRPGDPAAATLASEPETDSDSGYAVGTQVVLARGYNAGGDDDAVTMGPLKPGSVGTIRRTERSSTPYEVAFEGTTWWYKCAQLCRPGDANAARAADVDSSAAASDYAVGTAVVLAEGYQLVADSSGAPLQPGEQGTVIVNDGSDIPYKVRSSSGTKWYQSAALCLPGAPNAAQPGVRVKAADAAGPQYPALFVGDKVVRGPNWRWDEQDGGTGSEGTVLCSSDGWVEVQWDQSGDKNSYQYKAGDVDIVKAVAATGPGGATNSDGIAALLSPTTDRFYCGRRGLYRCERGCDGVCGPTNGCQCAPCAQLSRAKGKTTCQHNPGGGTADPGALAVGDRVRLADDATDRGGPLALGDVGEIEEVDSSALPYKVRCRGLSYWYKANDVAPLTQMGGSATAPGSGSSEPIMAEASGGFPALRAGDPVVRGPHWKWQDQDGGPGQPGIVDADRHESAGWVYIIWANGNNHGYRYGNGDCYDVVLSSYIPETVTAVRPGAAGAFGHASDWDIAHASAGERCFVCTTPFAEGADQIYSSSQHAATTGSLNAPPHAYMACTDCYASQGPRAVLAVGDAVVVILSGEIHAVDKAWAPLGANGKIVQVHDNGSSYDVHYAGDIRPYLSIPAVCLRRASSAADAEQFALGAQVVLRIGYADHSDAPNGPLKPGIAGKVVQSTPRRIQVEFADKQWWYDRPAICAVGAANAATAPIEAFPVGSEAVLAVGYADLSDASGGPLKPGVAGKVVKVTARRIQVEFAGKQWWYDRPAICAVGAANAATAPIEAFPVGSEAVLAVGYADLSDASGGPLKPGVAGKVVKVTARRIQVEFAGKQWWYDLPAICRPGASNAASPEPPIDQTSFTHPRHPHALTWTESLPHWICNVCRTKSAGPGRARLRCVACDWDCCQECRRGAAAS